MSEQLIQTPGVFGDSGNFLLERELGAGGMGGVYMGRDKILDRPVAVKVMLPEYGSDAEFVEKFKKEAQSAARLLHPNIAQIYSYGISNGMPYIAMELASGGSLYSLMNANKGKIDIQRTLKICQQTAQALQCATDQGVVHGDVKPENILLDANGNAKLVDFGLAAMQKDTTEIWGTPFYISPEKVKKEVVDFRADMYSLGGTLYHALTGVPPFDGDDAIAVVKKRFEGMPKKPSEIRPEITPAIDDLVMKMLELNKEDRYPSFEALLEAFKDVLTSGLTRKVPVSELSSTKSAAPGTKRVMTTRKRPIMKKPAGAAAKVTPETAATDDAAPKSTDDDEEEGGDNIAKKVILSVVGGILAIAAVVGGLVWYQVAAKNAEAAEQHAQIVSGIAKAREALVNTRAQAAKFDGDFKEFSSRATTECERLTKELAGLLPEYAADLKPAQPQPAVAETTSTNAPAATPAPQPAPAPATEGGEGGEKAPPPSAVFDMRELWERAYECQACQARISAMAMKVAEECDKAEAITEVSEAAAQTLGSLTSSSKDLYEQMTGSKDVETVKKAITFIKSKGDKITKQTVRELKIKKAEEDRARIKAEGEAADKARKEAEAAAKKALIEKETAEIVAKFNSIAAQGCFRQLDWASATRQLKQVSDEYKTAEGQIAAGFQLHKVEQMKSVQDIFIKKANGFAFKVGKIKGGKISKIDVKEIQIQTKDKKTVKIAWQKFYNAYPGNFNELLNTYVLKGRQNAGLNLSGWKDAMTGAALTMKLVCSDLPGANEKGTQLAKEIIKQMPEEGREKAIRDLTAIFPDIDFASVSSEE